MTIRRFFTFLRLLFLAICLAAVGARVVWTKYPEKVDRLDNLIVKTSEHRVRRELSRARVAKKAGDAEAAAKHLTNVANKTKQVKHGDRLESVRVGALTSLREDLAGRGEFEYALDWSNELHSLNDRNTPNELARAKLMDQLGLQDEAVALFAQLSDLAQGRAEFDLPYLRALIRANRSKDALSLLLNMSEGIGLEVPLDAWEFRHRVPGTAWSNSLQIEFSHSAGDVRTGTSETEVLAADVRELRIDLPRGSSLIAKGPTIILTLSEGSPLELGVNDILILNQMKAEEGGFRTQGSTDPYLVLGVPELPEGTTLTGYTLNISLLPMLPEEVQEFVSSDAGLAALAELAADYEAGAGTPRQRANLVLLQEVIRG